MIKKAGAYPEEIRVNMRDGEGQVHIRPLVTEDLPLHCRMWNRIEIPAGASIGYHLHEGESELFYFISGSGEVLDNQQRLTVGPGDSMVTGYGDGHSVINTGTGPLVMLACIITE